MDEQALRQEIVEAARSMNALGINQGTSGNVSARCSGRMLITPSGAPYETMRPQDLAAMQLDGDGAWDGPLRPSTEWRFHLGILRERAEDAAVVHTHAPYCTALSILRKPIPAAHYMIAAFGGEDVRCAPYALFGTAALAAHALRALDGRRACLLANHGMVVAGPSLARAMWLAVELEALARQYWLSLQAGAPRLLNAGEIAEAREAFAGYGAQQPAAAVGKA